MSGIAASDDRETPDATVVEQWSLERMGKYPVLAAWYRQAVEIDEDGDGVQDTNVFGKPLHGEAQGWSGWMIRLDSNHPACRDRMSQILQNATQAVLDGAGDVDIDAAVEPELMDLEMDRRNDALPEGAEVRGSPT